MRTPIECVKAVVDCDNRRDWAGYRRLIHDDYLSYVHGKESTVGAEAEVEALARWWKSNPERALPLMPKPEADAHRLVGDWTAYPQLYWWEGPDGGSRAPLAQLSLRRWAAVRVRPRGRRDGPTAVGLALDPSGVQSPDWPYDPALLYGGAMGQCPGRRDPDRERGGFQPALRVSADRPGSRRGFLSDVERRYGASIPVAPWRHGDVSRGRRCSHGGAAGAVSRRAARGARDRRARLVGRAAGCPPTRARRARRRRAEERRTDVARPVALR